MLAEDKSRLQDRLLSWITSRPAGGCVIAPKSGTAIVVVEDGDSVDDVLASDLVADDTLVLAPVRHDDPRAFAFRGSLTEPGEEAAVEESVFVQLHEYRSAPYVTVLAPTFARISDRHDFRAFLSDADKARSAGEFADFLLNPAIMLADTSALGASTAAAGPSSRLVVKRDGSISTSPTGLRLGQIGSSFASVDAVYQKTNHASAQPCAVSLASVVDETTRSQSLDDRPWIGRYLAVLDAMKVVRARDATRVMASGFGHRLSRHTESVTSAESTTSPLLLWSDRGAYLVAQQNRRTIQVSLQAGELVEALLVAGSVDEAADLVGDASVAQVNDAFTAKGLPLVRSVTVTA